jgi:ribosome-associated heat shock protein Hsp15
LAKELDRQRIDKWLWHARVVRTRSAAAALAASGHVRLNGQRINAPSHAVRLGDVVTVALDRSVRVLKVAGFAERRGGPESTQALWQDLSPPPVRSPEGRQEAAPAEPGLRGAGAGRPTKRERRAIDRLQGDED